MIEQISAISIGKFYNYDYSKLMIITFTIRTKDQPPESPSSVYVRLYDYNHSHIFTNKNNCYGKMFENDNPWYNYLMWEFEDED